MFFFLSRPFNCELAYISSYTTLVAKHIACGSLPPSDPVAFRSIYVTSSVLTVIREGRHIKDSARNKLTPSTGPKEPADLFGTKAKRDMLRAKEPGMFIMAPGD